MEAAALPFVVIWAWARRENNVEHEKREQMINYLRMERKLAYHWRTKWGQHRRGIHWHWGIHGRLK